MTTAPCRTRIVGAALLTFSVCLVTPAVAQTAAVEDTLILPQGIAPGDGFGRAVAASGDQLVVSAFAAGCSPAGGCGGFQVYDRSSGSWLKVVDVQGGLPGYASSLDVDGDRLVVSNGGGGGLFDVYEQSAFFPWTLSASIPAPAGAPTEVVVDVEGDLVMVGVPGDDTLGVDAGTAYLYQRTGGIWTLITQLFADNPAPFQRFGASVGVGDGYVLVGRPTTPSRNPAVWGGVWVYEPTATGWIHTAKLRAPDGGPGREIPVSMAVDGDRVALAEQGSLAAGGPASGAVHLYERTAGEWFYRATIDPPDPDTFDLRWGSSVDLDGDRLLICPRFEPRTWVFREQPGAGWQAEAVLVPRAPWGDVVNVACLGPDYTVVANPSGDLVVTDGGELRIHDEPYASTGDIVCVPGSTMACPCGNDPGQGVPSGCRNSQGFGAILVADGSTSALSDDMNVTLNGIPADGVVVLWAMPGAAAPRLSFGGIACVGSGARRVGLGGQGAQGFGPGLLALSGASPGETWTFQAVYRDPAAACGVINWTNAVEVDLVP